MPTLGELKENGYQISLHCGTYLPGGRVCVHYSTPSMDQLIQYFGRDFDVTIGPAEFRSRFVCEVCGNRDITSQVTPVHKGGGGAGRVHEAQPSDAHLAASRQHYELMAEQERLGIKTNAQEAAISRERRRKQKADAKSGADFIGPPNPWAHRKKGHWL